MTHNQGVVRLFRIEVFKVGTYGCSTAGGSYCSCCLHLNIWQTTSSIWKTWNLGLKITALCKVSPLPAPVISAPGCPDHHCNTQNRTSRWRRCGFRGDDWYGTLPSVKLRKKNLYDRDMKQNPVDQSASMNKNLSGCQFNFQGGSMRIRKGVFHGL